MADRVFFFDNGLLSRKARRHSSSATPGTSARLFGVRQVFYLAGTAVGMLTPPLFARAAGDVAAGSAWMAAVFGILTGALILISFTRVRERPQAHAQQFRFVEGLRVTFRNRAFVVLMVTYLVALVGGSFIAPLTLYVGKYVIKAEWVVPFVMLAYLLGSIGSIGLWVRLAGTRGKNWTWSVGMVAGHMRVCRLVRVSRGHVAAVDRSRRCKFSMRASSIISASLASRTTHGSSASPA